MQSFETDPDLYSYLSGGDSCPACMGSSTTPDSVQACLSGIGIGTLWTPSDPIPPNGAFKLDFDTPCNYKYSDSDYDIHWSCYPTTSVLTVTVSGSIAAFYDGIGSTCETEFSNFFNLPTGRTYYGGNCVIVPPLDCNLENLADFLALMNISAAPGVWCTPRQKSDGSRVFGVFSEFDQISVRIAYST